MVIREKRGWIWTRHEKQWVSTWKCDLQTQQKQVVAQLACLQAVTPHCMEEPVRVGESFVEAATRLLTAVEGMKQRRFQPLSPDQVKASLAEVQQLHVEWTTFLHRADVSQVIEAAKQRVQACARPTYKKRTQFRRNFQANANGPVFCRLMTQWLADLLALEMIELSPKADASDSYSEFAYYLLEACNGHASDL